MNKNSGTIRTLAASAIVAAALSVPSCTLIELGQEMGRITVSMSVEEASPQALVTGTKSGEAPADTIRIPSSDGSMELLLTAEPWQRETDSVATRATAVDDMYTTFALFAAEVTSAGQYVGILGGISNETMTGGGSGTQYTSSENFPVSITCASTSDRVLLYGYAPKQQTSPLSTSGGRVVWPVTVSDPYNATDIVASYRMESGSSATLNPVGGTMTFCHLLTPVTVRYSGTAGVSGTIESVTFGNVYMSGNYDLVNKSWSDLSNAGSVTLSSGVTVSPSSTDVDLVGTNLFIPQSLASSTISIKATINGTAKTFEAKALSGSLPANTPVRYNVTFASLKPEITGCTSSMTWGAAEYGSGYAKSITVTGKNLTASSLKATLSGTNASDFTVGEITATGDNVVTVNVYPNSENESEDTDRTATLTVAFSSSDLGTGSATCSLTQSKAEVGYEIVITPADPQSLKVFGISSKLEAYMYKTINGVSTGIAVTDISNHGWEAYTSINGYGASEVVSLDDYSSASCLQAYAHALNAGTCYVGCYATAPDGYVYESTNRVQFTVTDNVENRYKIEISYPKTTIAWNETTGKPTVTMYYNRYVNGEKTASRCGATTLSSSALKYSSGTASVATVATDGNVTGVSGGSSVITATYSATSGKAWETDGNIATATITVTDVSVSKYYIELSLSPTSIYVGGTSTGTVNLYHNVYTNGVKSQSGVSDGTISSGVSLSSGNTGVATASGLTATGVSGGTATITATATGYTWETDGHTAGTATASLTVYPEPTVSPTSLTWTATQYGSGSAKTATVEGTNVKFKSCSSDKFTTGFDGKTLTVYPKNENTTTSAITGTVTLEDGGGNTCTVSLTQSAASIDYKIEIDDASTAASVDVGSTVTFTAKMYKQVNGGNWTESTYTNIAWASDAAATASVVASTGVVTGKKAGSTYIGVSAKDETGTVRTAATKRKVTVSDVVNYKIEIDDASTAASVDVGSTVTFSAKMYKQVNGGDWTESTYTDIAWASDAAATAEVAASTGVVTGKKAGSTYIGVSAKDETGVERTAATKRKVTVSDVVNYKIEIDDASTAASVDVGSTVTFSAKMYKQVNSGDWTESTYTDIAWASDAAATASVVASTGVVKGEKAGSTYIGVSAKDETGVERTAATKRKVTVSDVITYDLVITDASSDISLNFGSSSSIIQAQMYKVVNGTRSKTATSMSSPGWDVYTTASGTTASSVVEFVNEYDTATILMVYAKGKNAGTGYISCHATGPDGKVHTAVARRKVVVSDVVVNKYYITISLNPTGIYVGGTSKAAVKLYHYVYTNNVKGDTPVYDKDLDASDLTMASSDETVATQSGLTSTGVGEGTSSISATYAGSGSYTWETGGNTASATLTVYPALTVSPTSLTWTATQSGSDNAKTATVKGNSVEIKSCSDEFTATLKDGILTVYPKNENTTTSAITGTVTLEDGGGNTCTVSLTQSAGTVDYKVEITSSVSSMTSGETATFAAKAYKKVNGGSWTEYSTTITWSSSNTSVATVGSSTGTVTAQNVSSSSTATITASATIGGTSYSDSETVTVNPADTYYIELTLDQTELGIYKNKKTGEVTYDTATATVKLYKNSGTLVKTLSTSEYTLSSANSKVTCSGAIVTPASLTSAGAGSDTVTATATGSYNWASGGNTSSVGVNVSYYEIGF